MYLSILRLWNFRKYAGADNKPGLEIHFQKGVNVLIGENDSGKTAIVDAIRYVLRTQSGEFIQFEDKDFYQDSDGNRKDEFKILTDRDSGNPNVRTPAFSPTQRVTSMRIYRLNTSSL